MDRRWLEDRQRRTPPEQGEEPTSGGSRDNILFSKSRENEFDDLCVRSLDGVPACKYLAIRIDKKLSFKRHVDELVKK